MTNWHVITGEYPPQPGGVSDYTALVARGLAAAGDRVTVWAPPAGEGADPEPVDGVTVRRLPDTFGRASLRALAAALEREPAPRRILVQYVPHAFGWKALNVPFCFWLRSRRRDSVWVMFHEVAFPIERRQTLAQNVVGIVTRRMAALVAASAERAFVSIPAWEVLLRTLTSSPLPIAWLPVPSAIPVVRDPEATSRVRSQFAEGGQPIVGHFGTDGAHTRGLLEPALPLLLASSNCRVLLLGRNSDRAAARLTKQIPAARGRVRGAGTLGPREVSVHLSACDVMLQPYPDGISSRRTSAMAGLAHGVPTVTTDGALTEPFWRESGGVVLSPAGDAVALAASAAALAADRARAARMGREARAVYDARFDIRHTIEALTRPAEPAALGAAS